MNTKMTVPVGGMYQEMFIKINKDKHRFNNKNKVKSF